MNAFTGAMKDRSISNPQQFALQTIRAVLHSEMREKVRSAVETLSPDMRMPTKSVTSKSS
jgi:hypothetical protein